MGNDFLKYVSTRGHQRKLKFYEVLFEGLAPDGGLYVPETWPQLDKPTISSFVNKNYKEIAYDVISPYIDDSINEDELRTLIKKSYEKFDTEEVTPLKKISDNEYLLELFHGPTYAFKDIAMQFIAQIMNFYLLKNQESINILGATSGDTGAAAIESFSKIKSANIFILHPHNMITDVQRKFMTTVSSPNVFNIAIKGNFDDCQKIIKEIFSDNDFKKSNKLTAINSINWARIMCQIVYYFYSISRLNLSDESIVFSVPTGNFGDIFAGYLASKMGLRINGLNIATNENDILVRTLTSGKHELRKASATSSPSIDIQLSSNFERLLYDITNDENYIKQIMEDLNEKKSYTLDTRYLSQIKKMFSAHSVNEKEVYSTIASLYNEKDIIIDPHTAVGLAAGRKYEKPHDICVTLSTAHPAKFKNTVSSIIKDESYIPDRIKKLFNLDEKMTILENDTATVKEFILGSIQ